MARESALGVYKSMLPSYSAPSLFDVRRAAPVVIGFEFIIHDLRYLLQLYLVIVIQCYCVSHPPPHTTPDVLYNFLTLFPVPYYVHEVFTRFFLYIMYAGFLGR